MPAANGIWIQCHYCGKDIYRPQWWLKRQSLHFCDNQCRGAWLSTQTGPDAPAYKGTMVQVHCSQCGKPIERDPAKVERNDHFFCGAECWNQWRKVHLRGEANPNFSTPAIETTCAWCGIAIQRKPWKIGTVKRTRHFCCAAHRAEWLKNTLVGPGSPHWRGGNVKYYGPNWRQQQRLARKRDNNRCQVCGKTAKKNGRDMDVHHIKPFRSFDYVPGQNENCEQANALGNLICLCRACHKKAESGKIAVQPNLL